MRLFHVTIYTHQRWWRWCTVSELHAHICTHSQAKCGETRREKQLYTHTYARTHTWLYETEETVNNTLYVNEYWYVSALHATRYPLYKFSSLSLRRSLRFIEFCAHIENKWDQTGIAHVLILKRLVLKNSRAMFAKMCSKNFRCFIIKNILMHLRRRWVQTRVLCAYFKSVCDDDDNDSDVTPMMFIKRY